MRAGKKQAAGPAGKSSMEGGYERVNCPFTFRAAMLAVLKHPGPFSRTAQDTTTEKTFAQYRTANVGQEVQQPLLSFK